MKGDVLVQLVFTSIQENRASLNFGDDANIFRQILWVIQDFQEGMRQPQRGVHQPIIW